MAKRISMWWAGALLAGMTMGAMVAQEARADDAPPPPKNEKKTKKPAKTGEACTEYSDCDQSVRQICRDGKCVVQRTPPPT